MQERDTGRELYMRFRHNCCLPDNFFLIPPYRTEFLSGVQEILPEHMLSCVDRSEIFRPATGLS